MAAKSVDQSKLMLRMCDLTSEPKRMLPPIKGYEKEPLVSLEKAIQPLLSLVANIKQMVWTVKQNCQHPHDHLSPDESASVMLYTYEWMPRESSFYFILNNTLRSQNRNELLPWFLYLRLLMFALSKLPPTKHRMIYRGIKMDVRDDFPKDKTFVWWAFSSSTSSIDVLEQFLGQSGHRTIFNIECDSAKDISKHSFYGSENEMLMYPARQFQVISSMNPGNQLKIIHLKEIQPPFSLIHIPPSSSTSAHPIKEIKSPISRIHISQPSSTKTYQNKRLEQLIKQCEHHSRMNLEGQNLTDEDMEIVAKEAIINKQCTMLNLMFNKITAVGASIIANKALNNNNALEYLFLGNNYFCDIGVLALTKALSLNSSKLQFLNLQASNITDEGAGYIASMLKANSTLQYLLLGWNKISDRGIEPLVDVLIHHNKALKYLHIGRCNLSEDGKEKLRQIMRSKKDFQLHVDI